MNIYIISKFLILIIINVFSILLLDITDYDFQYIGQGLHSIIHTIPSYVNHPGLPLHLIVKNILFFLNKLSIDLKLSIIITRFILFVLDFFLIIVASLIINKNFLNIFFKLFLAYSVCFPLFLWTKISPYPISYCFGAIFLSILIYKKFDYKNYYFYLLALIFSISVSNLTITVFFIFLIFIYFIEKKISFKEIITNILLFLILSFIFYFSIFHIFFSDYLFFHIKNTVSFFIQYLFFINLNIIFLIFFFLSLIILIIYFVFYFKNKKFILSKINFCYFIFFSILIFELNNILFKYSLAEFSIYNYTRYYIPILSFLIFYKNKVNNFFFKFLIIVNILVFPLKLETSFSSKNLFLKNNEKFDKLIERLIILKINNILVSQGLKTEIKNSNFYFYNSIKENGNNNINFLNYKILAPYDNISANINYLYLDEHSWHENKFLNELVKIREYIISNLSFYNFIFKNIKKIESHRDKNYNLCLGQLKNMNDFILLQDISSEKYNNLMISIISNCNFNLKYKEYEDNFVIVYFVKNGGR